MFNNNKTCKRRRSLSYAGNRKFGGSNDVNKKKNQKLAQIEKLSMLKNRFNFSKMREI